MSFPRSSGILLHPTSLPSRFGIGSLGAEAYRFVDFLVSAGQHLWQVLPLGPTGYGNSPYQALSAFAGDPLLISLERLAEEGFLEPSLLANVSPFPEHRVDYHRVATVKWPMLEESFQRFERAASPEQVDAFEAFRQQHRWWLGDFALFMALRRRHGLAAWNTWPEGARRREPGAMDHWQDKLEWEVRCQEYLQFQFFRQWTALKAYCNARGVKIIGDVPIYVAQDSADVWAQQEMFHLDASGAATVVAGVPPDYFSKTGQRWGNPIYRWDEMAKDGYRWWIARIQGALQSADIVRLDHFRGFERYWEVPAGESTAVIGRWAPGPGAGLFDAIQHVLGSLPIIAEDLGIITPEVHALRDRFCLPGMRVLQFAFGGNSRDNPHLPHNHQRNCVVYTGTHDNDTTVGWFGDGDAAASPREDGDPWASSSEQERALKYVGSTGREVNWDFIRAALASVADTAIIPLQDVLGLGSGARMNRPGTLGGNWEWRFTFDLLTEGTIIRLRELTELYGR